MQDDTMTVVSNRELVPSIYELVLTGELATKMVQPGQFVDVLLPDPEHLLRRPFGVAKQNQDKKEMTLIYRVVGDGTEILAKVKPNKELQVMGLLGQGFPIDFLTTESHVLVVGGGLGTPPLYELGRQLKAKSISTDFVFGYNDVDLMYYTDEFSTLGNLTVATMDGSYGFKGHVGQVLDAKFETTEFDAVYACGPTGLLLAIDNRYQNHPHAYVSLESRMACAVGACYACVVPDRHHPEHAFKVCDDGPVFETGEVVIL